MGFVGEFRKALSGDSAGEPVTLAGRQLVCTHCGNNRFYRSKALLNTSGLTFLDLDWANRSATIFECANCGRIEWFVGSPKRAEQNAGSPQPISAREVAPSHTF